MTSFMLWFDDSQKRTLIEKVKLAAAHYGKKYGKAPDTCLVPISMADAIPADETVDGIAVRVWRGALPNHLYIGVEEKEPEMGTGSAADVNAEAA